MHRRIAAILLLPLSAIAGESRVFTDATGRQVEAELVDCSGTTVTLQTKDGRKSTLPMERFSPDDREFIRNWRTTTDQAAAAAKRAVELPAALVDWCKARIGQQVGNGECWTLADEAFKACGARRPGGDLRVWGPQIHPKTDKIHPGDIVEFRSAKFKDGSATGPEHTAVVVAVVSRRKIVIAEQNWSNHKTVHERTFNPDDLSSGDLMFYRPG